jgi:hypothetical protein
MSRTTRLSTRDTLRAGRGALAAIALVLVAAGHSPFAAASANAPTLPAGVRELTSGLAARGGGEMRFLGLSIYDGWYWSAEPGWSLDTPFALDLHYHRTFAGSSIARRSVDEIERLGIGDAPQRARWGAAMRAIFPDVVEGDRLTGVFVPPATVRFFRNGELIGQIEDRQFARAFFGIWLDPRTSRADFRNKLLGAP